MNAAASLNVRNTQGVVFALPQHSSTDSPGASNLMPTPQAAFASGDAMSALYALLSKQRNNDIASGTNAVNENREMQRAEDVKQQVALKKQEDAEANAKTWGVFGKIASVVAIAVSAYLAGITAGAASGLCAAACILSTMAFAEGEAHVLTTVTHNPDSEKAFQIGCGIGAALCSGGAGIANLATAATQTAAGILSSTSQVVSAECTVAKEVLSASNDKTCQDASMALGIAATASAVVGSAGGAAAGASDAEGATTAVAEVVKGATEISAGIGTIGASKYEADATDRSTDAKQSSMQIAHLQRLTEWLVSGIKENDSSHKRALQTLQGTMQTQSQTLVIASARV